MAQAICYSPKFNECFTPRALCCGWKQCLLSLAKKLFFSSPFIVSFDFISMFFFGVYVHFFHRSFLLYRIFLECLNQITILFMRFSWLAIVKCGRRVFAPVPWLGWFIFFFLSQILIIEIYLRQYCATASIYFTFYYFFFLPFRPFTKFVDSRFQCWHKLIQLSDV